MLERETRDPETAFEDAIVEGRLSVNPTNDNHAGKYMFMGRHNGKDTFKNINTRKYDV